MAKISKSPVFTIFLTIFIDMLGVGIMIPVFAPLIINNQIGIVPSHFSEAERKIIYGFLTATFSIFQFFGAPILGGLADLYGRKKILSYTIMGTVIGYLFFAAAIYSKQLWLVFIARMIPGFMGGNISIALAALADVSDEKSKPKNFGLVGMSFGLGFILGPGIGGILGEIDYSLPLFFTALLSLINWFLVRKQFPETFTAVSKKKISVWAGFHNIQKAFQLDGLRVILLVIFLQAFGFTFFTQFFPVFMIDKFGVSERMIGYLFTYIGVWIALTQGVITRFVSKKYNWNKVLSVSLLGMAVTLGMMLIPNHIWGIFVVHPMLAIFQGLTQPNITTAVSSLGSEENQGEVLGIQTSVQSLAFGIPPIIAGYISAIDFRLPIIVGSSFLILSWIIYITWQNHLKRSLKAI